MADETFYRDLVAFDDFSTVCEEQHYSPVPKTWDLVMTDVESSTQAIAEGRYKDVNAAGVASMVAVRNAMKDVDIPFVFGGDGATMLTPRSRREPLRKALRGLRRACRESFDLGMRVGIVPIETLSDAGHDIEVARFAASAQISFAMLRGDGVDVAETWIKDPLRAEDFAVSEDGECDSNFAGFQCRWKPVPSRHGVVASVIVRALPEDRAERQAVYREDVTEIARLVTSAGAGRPVAQESLHLPANDHGFTEEVSLLAGGPDSGAGRRLRRKTQWQLRVVRFLLNSGFSVGNLNPRAYTRELVANTDFRKFDNTLRMHLDLRPDELENLVAFLGSAELRDRLAYGIHCADHSLITCFIDSFEGSHAHFVDGANGGYALAAQQIKDRLGAR